MIVGAKRSGFGLRFDGNMPLLRTENTRNFKKIISADILT